MEIDYMRLSGKSVIVTGAGRGIGRAIAIAYAREGAGVCLAARTESQIRSVAEEIEAAGGRAIAVPTDVADWDSVQAMVGGAVNAFGGLDVAVLNAGVLLDGGRTLEESVIDDWRRTIEVNLIGAYLCAKAVIPPLKSRGQGKIIITGSGNGHHGRVRGSSYGASKAGLWMVTRILSEELLEDRIDVNEIVPGPVYTELARELVSDPATRFAASGEWAKQPEELVDVAMFLATQPSPGPTGQSFSLLRRPL
ncbi:MAG: SDR family oxidoreductase [Chloroflexi bacterium]|nr:SDR family oxidoreductase [Chloroflexota bacterium]